MTVGEGKFLLYSRIEAPLQAGDYRFTVTQNLSATGFAAGTLPVDELAAHVTVRSPRYTLPPDQVLSTFPPAGSEGAYGSRLPQVVIRRRTLPWERLVQTGVDRSTPWLALVLIAEGEGELVLNQPVADAVTPGKTLAGDADVELGNYLKIRKSVVDRVFPTRLDVPLLAHAREVDITDTELMMGDDDGFLAVVIGNRLPVAGTDPSGDPAPVKYLACLVNLEGQFLDLIERAPEPSIFTKLPVKAEAVVADLAQWDHVKMGKVPFEGAADALVNVRAAGDTTLTGGVTPIPSSGAAAATSAQNAGWSARASNRVAGDVYAEMAMDFNDAVVSGFVAGNVISLDPTLRFPVLLHWSFTSFGSTTFRSLVEGLDSGLIGTVGEEPVPAGDSPGGRPPLEVVETGHVGLPHTIRRGDTVRCWYRGPFVPHPTTDPPSGRLPLAHAADQLRIVVPDGREDISLAASFEIGRLLALARPSILAALMRWRQEGYQTARLNAVWSDHVGFLDEVLTDTIALDHRIGMYLGRGLAKAVTARPEQFLGDPAPLVTRGRTLPIDDAVDVVLARGFGLDAGVFRGDPVTVLGQLREVPVLRADLRDRDYDAAVSAALGDALRTEVGRLIAQTAAAGPRAAPDPLDRLLEALEDRPGGADDDDRDNRGDAGEERQ